MARFLPLSTDLPRLRWVWSMIAIVLIGAGGAVLRAEDEEKKEAPKYDAVEPKPPAQFNPDPGGRQAPVQATSPAAAPLPSLFEPVVPTRPAEFAEDLPPVRCRCRAKRCNCRTSASSTNSSIRNTARRTRGSACCRGSRR